MQLPCHLAGTGHFPPFAIPRQSIIGSSDNRETAKEFFAFNPAAPNVACGQHSSQPIGPAATICGENAGFELTYRHYPQESKVKITKGLRRRHAPAPARGPQNTP